MACIFTPTINDREHRNAVVAMNPTLRIDYAIYINH
jgi:hypothetical protein